MTHRNALLRRLAAGLIAALMVCAPITARAQAMAPVIYLVEQLASPALPPELMEKLKPMLSLAEVEEMLKANDIPFSWRKAQLDSSVADPALITQIEALPPGEVFVIPQGPGLVYNVIIAKRPKPAA